MRRVFLGFILMTTFWGGSLMAVALRTGYLEGHIDRLQEFYAQEISAAFQEGERFALAATRNIYELDREAISLVLSRYPAVEAPYECAGWILDAAREFKVPAFVLLGQFCQESSGRAAVVSSAGCVGVMQVNWAIWGEMLACEGIARSKEDLKDTRTCIRAGARVLRQLIVRYDGDLGKALRHYSGGARRYEDKIFARATGW